MNNTVGSINSGCWCGNISWKKVMLAITNCPEIPTQKPHPIIASLSKQGISGFFGSSST
jgi:hypothetical protein